MANGSFQFSATSSDLQRAISAATQKARQQYGSGSVVAQDFVQDPQTGKYTGTIVYKPTPQEEKDALLGAVKRSLVEDARANGTVTPTPAPTATQAPTPNTVRNVRNNNPGNLRTGDVETAQQYYGEDAVTGVDEGGFAQFSSPEAGISALQQQVRVDTNRGMNLGEFLNKYTPESDDPSGNKAAKTNIPKLVNANLDTPLADIDPTELTLAITRQEGGNEALQAFGAAIKGSSAPTLADIERGAANAEKIAREREVETRFGQGSTLAPQDRTVSRDSAMLGMPTQSTTARQDDQLTKRLVGENIEEQGPQPTGTDVLNVRTDRDRSRFGMPASVVNDMSQNTSLSQPVLNYLQNEADFQVAAGRENLIPGTAGMILSEKEKEQRLEDLKTQPLFMEQGRATEIIGDDEQARDLKRGLLTRERDITDPDMTDDTVTADAEEVELDLEGMAPPQTLLQRIGNALKNNPELTASGFQLLGGLLSNAAQNRAQRRADRTTDQRVARANLISAITGGRARPTVERAQADTGGFMSLDTLGKALQGGGAAVKGELSRRVEEAERERKAGLDKQAAELAAKRLQLDETTQKNTKEYKDAIVDLNKKELDYKIKKLTQEQNEANAPEKLSPTEIKEIVARVQAVAKTDELTDFLETADLSFLEKGQFSLKRVPQFLFGGNQAEAEARRQNLIQAMAESYGGKLSNQDIERIDAQLFTQKDNLKTSLQVAQVFRSTLLEGLRGEIRALEGEGYSVKTLNDMLNEVDQGQSESDADRLGSMLSDNPLDRISRQ